MIEDDEEDTRDPREVYLLPELPQSNDDVSLDDMMAMLGGDLLPSDIHRRRELLSRREKTIANIGKVVRGLNPDVLKRLLRWAEEAKEVSVNGVTGIPSTIVIPAIKERLATIPVRLNKEEKRAAAKANHGRSKCRNR
jgi:hypothetical protein